MSHFKEQGILCFMNSRVRRKSSEHERHSRTTTTTMATRSSRCARRSLFKDSQRRQLLLCVCRAKRPSVAQGASNLVSCRAAVINMSDHVHNNRSCGTVPNHLRTPADIQCKCRPAQIAGEMIDGPSRRALYTRFSPYVPTCRPVFVHNRVLKDILW